MKPTLSTLKRWAQYGLTDIRSTVAYVAGGPDAVSHLCLKRLIKILHKPDAPIDGFLRELKDIGLTDELSQTLAKFGYRGQIGFPEGLYVLVRILRPNIVVETGVCTGFSSSFILAAMERNASGNLHSVDAPNYELEYFPKLGLQAISLLPDDKEPGFAILERLKTRWHLHLGRSREVLPSLLRELGPIDIFLHDSEHTVENMLFEYETAWKYVRQGGLLLSDNISVNESFKKFARSVHSKPVPILFSGWGGLAKVINPRSAQVETL